MKRYKIVGSALAAVLLLAACSGEPQLAETEYWPLGHRLAYEHRNEVIESLDAGIDVSEIDAARQLADLCLELGQYLYVSDDLQWLEACQVPTNVWNPNSGNWEPAD